jgi:hypothetical protein
MLSLHEAVVRDVYNVDFCVELNLRFRIMDQGPSDFVIPRLCKINRKVTEQTGLQQW